MSIQIQIRRDTAANWSSNNPTLASGEMGLDQTNNFLKMGDGSTAWNSLGQFTQNIENVEDLVGAMVTSNTETFITVTYEDGDGTLDFVVPVHDEDDLSSDSASHLATQQSIKAYVDAQVTAQDLDFIADSGGALMIDIDSETMTFTGGTGIDTSGSGNAVTFAIDSTVVTKDDTQTLTAKTLTSPVINTSVSGSAILDEDDMSSNSATQLATQQSIKKYVDDQIDTADQLSELSDVTLTAAADGSMLLYDTGNSVWIDNVMSGDATLADTGALTLATVNSNVGQAGSSTAIPVVTVNAKGLVTAVSTAAISSALTISADSGTNDSVTVGTDTLTFAGGTGIDTVVSDNQISSAIDSTVATLLGSQTLSNKTLSIPTIDAGVYNSSFEGSAFLDEDNMASDASNKVASQQSIKAYVDGQTTDETAEGSSNLYHTTERVQDISGAQIATNGSHTNITAAYDDAGDGAIDLSITDSVIRGKVSVTDAGGDGSLAYNSSTGVITYTGPSAAEVRAHHTAGTGVSISSGEIAIGQAVATTSDVTFGDVIVSGDLTVSGDTATVNTSTLAVEDPLISLATGNNASDVVDIGIYGLYDTSGSQDLYGGLFRDANDSGKWKLYKDSQAAPTTTVNTSATGHATGTLVANLEGNVTGNVTGNASGTALTVTQAAQTAITSLGTLTGLTVDDVAIDGKVITMTGSTSDTAVITVGTNGTLSIVTTDDAAAAANIQITADGTVDIDSAGVLTLDSGAAINLEPASGSAILLDGTISVDAGVVTGATSITSTAFVGDITGDVTGNASGTALTVTQAAQTAITSLGTLTGLSMTGNLNMEDSDKIIMGTGDDLEIYHDGSNSYIKDVGDGDLIIQAQTNLKLQDGESHDYLTAVNDGAVSLFYDNSKKFETTSAGATITGVLTATSLTGDVTGDVTGTVSSIANHDTDDLSEGSTNLYYTDARARASITVTDAGGDGSCSISNGVITYTGPSSAEVRAHLSAGTGVGYSAGVISIGQSVATTADVDFATIDTTGAVTIGGRATMTKKVTGIQKNYATPESWAVTTDSDQTGFFGGDFEKYGDGNVIEHGLGPDGRYQLLWITKNQDAASDADGGWDKTITNLPGDDTNYMSVVYVRRTSSTTTGTFSHGCDGSHTLNIADNSTQSNPKFCTGTIDNLPEDVWCVSIGFINGNSNSATSSLGISGVYRMDTGAKVLTGTDFKMKDGSTTQRHRTYMDNATNTSDSIDWANPGFYACDGTEPTYEELTHGVRDKINIYNVSGTLLNASA